MWIPGRIIVGCFSLYATVLAGCATAPEPRPSTEAPYSEFVYEALGATPSIRFGTERRETASPGGRGTQATAAANPDSNEQRRSSREKDGNGPS